MKEKDYETSLKYFEKSISFGNIESMYEYWRLLFQDKFSILNKKEGIRFYQKAIEKGCLKALYKYGILLIKKLGNEEKGIQYIKNAAEKEYPKALYYYSQILDSNEMSFQYLKKAAYKGLIMQCFNMEINYQKEMKM